MSAYLADQERLDQAEESEMIAPIDFWDDLSEGRSNDILINDLYGKERVARIEIFGLELDELWSFVGKKKNKVWIWLAFNPANGQIVGFHGGKRTKEDAQKLWESIPVFFRQQVGFFSDYWKSYKAVFDPQTHYPVGKDSGLTAHIERFNCTLRQRTSRLVRKSLSFSKSIENHLGAIRYFISWYNQNIKALKL